MIQLLNIDSDKWDELVCSFAEYDVYYLSGYVKAFALHGDGKPQLLYYEHEGLRAIYVYMKRMISEDLYDTITPYGYGGILFEGDTSKEKVLRFREDYLVFMQGENVVDNFVRYHPVLKNAEEMMRISTVINLGKTIAMDITSPDVIWENIVSKSRNMIRKAEKNGIEIRHGRDFALFTDFKRIYNATMDKDQAEEYYYFDDNFYASIHKDLFEHYEMFYAVYEGEIIAMSIMIFANKRMSYHLSGSVTEYRNLAPTNLLLYKAALWGCEQGFKTFHLGGGVGSGEDNLYKFKAAFNKNSDYQFSIGKEIFNEMKYKELVEKRKNNDSSFDESSHFFPLYRS